TGTFAGLPVTPGGTPVQATFGATTYNFLLSYAGADGNDIVLLNVDGQPSVAYVDDAVSNFGTASPLSAGRFIVDADPGTPGDQTAIFGFTAFNAIHEAVGDGVHPGVAPGGTVVVQHGVYSETVDLTSNKTLRLTPLDSSASPASSTVEIGSLSGSTGSTIDLQSNHLRVGDASGSHRIDSVIQGAGSLTKIGDDTLILGGANTYSGGTTIGGGTLRSGANNVVPDSTVSIAAAAALDLDGYSDAIGALTIAAGPSSGGAILTGSGVLTLGGDISVTGGVSDVASATIAGVLDLGAASRTMAVSDAGAAVDLAITAEITSASGAFGLTKSGGGTLSLGGASTYTGSTLVSSGVLLATNSSGSATGSGAVTVAGGAKLGGGGRISGPVSMTDSSTISPGTLAATTGILTTGALTLGPSTTVQVQLNGATAGTGYDRISAPSVDLGGATLDLSRAATAALVAGSFMIVENTGSSPITGRFAGYPDNPTLITIDDVPFVLRYTGGPGNNDVVLSVVASTNLYVDDDWAGTEPGATPATSEPAGLIFGYNAFDNLQDALDIASPGGSVFIYGGDYATPVTIDKFLAPIRIAVNPATPAETTVSLAGSWTLAESATFNLLGATTLSFANTIDADVDVAAESLTINGGAGSAVEFHGAVGGTQPLGSLSTDAGGSTRIGANITTDGTQSYGDDVSLLS
ncbi:MAG TPA: autotransporter-associated beta strand repeat-containing protein, partial [Pirellulaceae bacterium]|nr:autotransporter-associated beta strand repeat-containing protein [Pirellulaceae bacterium]